MEPTDLVKASAGVRQREGGVKKTKLNPPKGEKIPHKEREDGKLSFQGLLTRKGRGN